MSQSNKFKAIELNQTRIEGGFWGQRLEINRTATLDAVTDFCQSTGRIEAFELAAKPERIEDENPNIHEFYDSDVAKWLEGLAHCLVNNPDEKLEALADEVIDKMAAAQQSDGYLNSYYTVHGLEKRFTNLRDMHELYCAGHLTEAAVAYYKATGKDKLLNVMKRYIDLIADMFGCEEGKIAGYPGHQELELALVKLYEITQNKKHLELAKFFIDQRGQGPSYFETEREKRTEQTKFRHLRYFQAHLPVRQQKQADGHSVRAMYLYAAMADVARITDDDQLLQACREIWTNTATRRMYITGGLGSCHVGERFTFDYDLPNEQAYAETCASIALMMFASRMLHSDNANGFKLEYGDVLELALHNGVLSGVSLDGKKFFYDNYLASKPPYHIFHGRKSPQRQQWFDCACCPTNIVRLFGSLGSYAYSVGENALAVHLYTSGKVNFEAGSQKVTVTIDTDYPNDEKISMKLNMAEPTEFELQLRIPQWCENAELSLNGQQIHADCGYVKIERLWKNSDTVELKLPMPPRRIYSHPSVRHNAGKVAIMRGPVVYCLEQEDNGEDLNALQLPPESKLKSRFDEKLLNGTNVIEADGLRLESSDNEGKLYSTKKPKSRPASLKFIPYALWANRSEEQGEMIVWTNEGK